MIAARSFLLAAVVIWGWTFVATKVCLGYMSPVELMGLRFTIALPVLAGLIMYRGVSVRFVGGGRALLLGAALFSLHFAVQISGIEHTSATNTGWIIAATPLVLALLAAWILREPVGRNAWIGIAVATVGVVLLVSRGRPGNLAWLGSKGDWLVLASAHTWALYTIAIRGLTRAYHPLALTLVMIAPAATLSLVVMAVTSDASRLARLPFEPLAAVLFLGVAGTALAHWFWQEGVARVGAARAGLFLYIEPLATMALAVPYLGEPLSVSTLVGGLLVLAGLALAQRRR